MGIKENNFKNLIYKFIDNGSIEIYLLLDQSVNKKKNELYDLNQQIKRSA